MTWAERLRAEGEAEGRAESEASANRSVLAKLLSAKFGELAAKVQSRLAAASNDELELWLERVLTANSLEGIFA